MKRVIVLTVVLFVLSLGGLAAVTLWMCRAQDQVEFTNIVSRGEDAAARGLYVTEHDNLSGRVHWATQHDLGNGSRETEATFSGKGTTYEGMTVGDFAAYSIYTQLPEAPQMEEYLRAHMDSGGDTATLRPADYAEYYDLCLSSAGSWPMITRWDKQEEDYDDFPAMHIPVGAEDRIKLNVYSYGSGMRYSLSEIDSANSSFISWGVTVEAGSVVTVGFSTETEPRADWAPGGFGLWLVRGGTREQPQKQIRLAYALDIEKQRVVKLAASPDKGEIFLFVEEDGQVTLQVIRSSDFALLQSVPVGKLGTRERVMRYYDMDGKEVVQRWSHDDQVLVNKGKGFYAVAVGRELTALRSKEEGGVEKLFSCTMPDLCVLAAVDGVRYAWEDENVAVDEILDVHNPADVSENGDFESMAMDLKDGKLAMAWNCTGLSEVQLLVEVYSEKGLEYARGIGCDLYRQSGNISSAQPEVAWGR